MKISLKWDAYAGVAKCECPLGVKVYVSTPLGPEHINDEVDDFTLLVTKKDDKNNKDDKNKKDDKDKKPVDNKPAAGIKIKFDTGGYIFIVVMVFLG